MLITKYVSQSFAYNIFFWLETTQITFDKILESTRPKLGEDFSKVKQTFDQVTKRLPFPS